MANRRNSKVVVNHEEQYALWPADFAPPAGWKVLAPAGTDEDLLAYLRGVYERTQDPDLARAIKTMSSGQELTR
jgi:MbtH protein